MGRPLTLDAFDSAGMADGLAIVLPNAKLEDERLQAFDRGYKAGWDDSAEAHATEQARISAELGSNLQALSFTYHEARGAMLEEMQEILTGIVTRVFPASIEQTLGAVILEQISEATEDAVAVPVEIVVAPENCERVRSLVTGTVAPPSKVIEEPSLGSGQAFLRLGQSERKIDLDAVLADISGAVRDFFEQPEEVEASVG